MASTNDVSRIARTMQRECLALRVRQLNRRVTRIYDAELRPHGVSTAQLNILLALALAGTARPTDIARGLDLEKSTLSRNLERMVASGWIDDASGATGNTRQLRLTPAGERVIERASPAWRAAQRQAHAQIHSDLLDALKQDPGPVR